RSRRSSLRSWPGLAPKVDFGPGPNVPQRLARITDIRYQPSDPDQDGSMGCQAPRTEGARVGRAFRPETLRHFRLRRAIPTPGLGTASHVARVGPTSMRKPLSRPERDDRGTSQTSIRRHPPERSAMRGCTVAPIPYRGVAMRHVGPRDATWVPLPISTWTASSPLCLCALDRAPVATREPIAIIEYVVIRTSS